jgi:hypothetical protein
MTKGIDASTSCAAFTDCLVAANITFVMRYYCAAGNPKLLSLAEPIQRRT